MLSMTSRLGPETLELSYALESELSALPDVSRGFFRKTWESTEKHGKECRVFRDF